MGPKLLFIMRGLPGSGKSTLAKSLLQEEEEKKIEEENNNTSQQQQQQQEQQEQEQEQQQQQQPQHQQEHHEIKKGVILSTDDFFITPEGKYLHDFRKIEEAHKWNNERALKSFEEGISPIFIDNTHVQAWEAKNYVENGLRFGYEIRIVEVNTPWRFDVDELVTRNVHQVPQTAISAMLKRWEHNITIETILESQKPNFKPRKPNTPKQRPPPPDQQQDHQQQQQPHHNPKQRYQPPLDQQQEDYHHQLYHHHQQRPYHHHQQQPHHHQHQQQPRTYQDQYAHQQKQQLAKNPFALSEELAEALSQMKMEP